ncbi:MAG: hypothetical protein AAFV96_15160, partial [Pseudomonadota bacterium]
GSPPVWRSASNRATAGLPAPAYDLAAAAVRIPLRAEARSLNVAQAAAVALFEALRQTDGLPDVVS